MTYADPAITANFAALAALLDEAAAQAREAAEAATDGNRLRALGTADGLDGRLAAAQALYGAAVALHRQSRP